MSVAQLTRPVTTPCETHGDENSTAFTYCNTECERCNQLMSEKSIAIKAGVFASAFGKPGQRSFVEAYNRYRNAKLVKLDLVIRAKRFEPNSVFTSNFDKGRIEWVDDVLVSV